MMNVMQGRVDIKKYIVRKREGLQEGRLIVYDRTFGFVSHPPTSQLRPFL